MSSLTCNICGTHYSPGGDGWDGMCPSCADVVSAKMDAGLSKTEAIIDTIQAGYAENLKDYTLLTNHDGRGPGLPSVSLVHSDIKAVPRDFFELQACAPSAVHGSPVDERAGCIYFLITPFETNYDNSPAHGGAWEASLNVHDSEGNRTFLLRILCQGRHMRIEVSYPDVSRRVLLSAFLLNKL